MTDRPRRRTGWALLVIVLTGMGCATSVSEITGLYAQLPPRAAPTPGRPVQVAFSIAHLAQQHGYDAVPKHRPPLVPEFEEIFRDAMAELPGVSAYTLTTETAPRSGVEVLIRPERSTDRDYLVRLVFMNESSFAADTLWALVSLASATLVPAPFAATYSVEATVYDAAGRHLRTYRRQARITNWLHGGLVLALPFRPPTGEREKLLRTLLRDLFGQMHAEDALLATTPWPADARHLVSRSGSSLAFSPPMHPRSAALHSLDRSTDLPRSRALRARRLDAENCVGTSGTEH